jgi:hypothetical protein
MSDISHTQPHVSSRVALQWIQFNGVAAVRYGKAPATVFRAAWCIGIRRLRPKLVMRQARPSLFSPWSPIISRTALSYAVGEVHNRRLALWRWNKLVEGLFTALLSYSSNVKCSKTNPSEVLFRQIISLGYVYGAEKPPGGLSR